MEYGEDGEGLGPNGYEIFDCYGGDCYWSAPCLHAHIQGYRTKYKDTAHPLRHVLFIGAPCVPQYAGELYTVPGMKMEYECIPMFTAMSYSYANNADATDWPYQVFTHEFMIQALDSGIYPFSWGPYDASHEMSLRSLNIDEYPEMVLACEGLKGLSNLDGISTSNAQGYTKGQFYSQLRTETIMNNNYQTPSGDEVVDNYSTMWRPDVNIGRLGAIDSSYEKYARQIETPVGHTIAYHNFQVLETSVYNMDFCRSADGGVPAYGYCNNSEADCVIEEEDALYSGCAHGFCEWFSADCGTMADVDHYKEYLGNSRHIGYNYSDAS